MLYIKRLACEEIKTPFKQKNDGFKQVYSQSTLMTFMIWCRCIHRLLRRYRATSPNLGEEPGYLLGVNAIMLVTNILTRYWLSTEQGN